VLSLRSSIIGSGTRTTTFPDTCAATISFRNYRDKSKRIAVEVHMVRATIEEFTMEQQTAGAIALSCPQNTKGNVDVETVKETQAEKVVKTILATDTEAFKSLTPNKPETKVAKTGANHQPL
jgi:predicted transcriptional regulator